MHTDLWVSNFDVVLSAWIPEEGSTKICVLDAKEDLELFEYHKDTLVTMAYILEQLDEVKKIELNLLMKTYTIYASIMDVVPITLGLQQRVAHIVAR